MVGMTYLLAEMLGWQVDILFWSIREVLPRNIYMSVIGIMVSKYLKLQDHYVTKGMTEDDKE